VSSNRQQLATGLKAILGGATGATRPPSVSSVVQTVEASVAAPEELTAAAGAPGGELEPVLTMTEPAAAPSTSAPALVRQSKPRRKPEVAISLASSDKRVGTLDRPYVRQRDNQATRKVGVVLPVDLAERLQIHCIKNRARPNSFIEQAIAMALDEVGA
jgi:hypothetical protein